VPVARRIVRPSSSGIDPRGSHVSVCAAHLRQRRRRQWSCVAAKAAPILGHPIGTSTTDSAQGFTVTWDYDGSTITVQCTDSPMLVPCLAINAYIKSVANDCGIAG
jgi:hypothetical protein